MDTAYQAIGTSLVIGLLIGLVLAMFVTYTLRDAIAVIVTTVGFVAALTFGSMLAGGWTP